MKPQFRLQPRHLADLAAIRDLGAEALTLAIGEVKKQDARPKLTSEIQAVFDGVLKDKPGGSEALLRQLLALHGLQRQVEISSEEIFLGIEEAIRNDSKWTEEDWKKWATVSSPLKELFELDTVRLSAKALDLSYEHTQLLQRARIVTDIRPVFNKDASQLCGTVISHSLLLRFDDPQGNHVLNLAVDETDIKDLVKQCERALAKSKTARDRLEGASIPTIMPVGKQ